MSLGNVRDEIKRQLDTTSQLPQMFTFLRRVGDFLTLVSETFNNQSIKGFFCSLTAILIQVSKMQEDMLKVKHFAPPYVSGIGMSLIQRRLQFSLRL